jgi:thymidylate synthase
VWAGGDCHIYSNHLEQVDTLLGRKPYPLPRLEIRRRPASIFDYKYEDFEFVNYQHHAPIKAPIAV